MATDTNLSTQFTRRQLSLAISAACAGLIPGAAIAQNDDAPVALEEIIVTATKRAVSLQDVPMSITAFTNADIVRAGFKQIDDYVAQIPSLSIASREPGGSNVIMRGCATSGVAFADTQSTAVYLDEQPISVAGFNPDPRLVDIERIEALSGPQGTLFGDSSQCGTLRIITNKPDITQFNSWIDLTGNLVEEGDSGFDISAMVNIPLANDKAAIRLVGFYADEPGYIDNVLTSSPGGEFFPGGTFDNADFVKSDINTTTVSGARAGLRIVPNDDWTLDLQAAFQSTESDGFGDVDLAENFHEGDSLGKWEQARFGNDYFKDEWYQVALGLEGSLGWGELTVAASFMNRENRYDADSTAYMAAWQEFYPYYNLYDFGGDPQAMAFTAGEQDRTSLEIRLATPADSDSRWSGVVGAFYNKSENYSHFSANVRQLAEAEGYNAFYYLNNTSFLECRGGTADVPGYTAGYYYTVCPSYYYDATSARVGAATPTAKWWDGVYTSQLEQVAIFGEATFELTENFSLTLGGRWFEIETDRTLANGALVASSAPYNVQGPEVNCGPTGDFTPSGTEITQDLCWTGVSNVATSKEDGFVPKVTATFSPTDNNMFYATYSEGFRRGGGNAARPTSIFGRAPFNQFDSDLVTNFEIGTKNTSADGRLQYNLTIYNMVWDDMQVEVEDPTPNVFTLGLVNVAEASIMGAEAFVSWLPADGLSLSASVGFNEAELSKSFELFSDADTPLLLEKGTRLPLTPDWKASIIANYDFKSQMFGMDPSLGVTYNYTGESVNSLAGIASTEVINAVRKQSAYSITNARYHLDKENWGVTVFINNIFNEYAELYYNDRWIQSRLTVNRPRTLGVSFRKNFQ